MDRAGFNRRSRARVDELRQPKVEDLDRAVVAHLDVGWLQIAMDDPLLVRGDQRGGDLPRERRGVGPWNGTLGDLVREGWTIDQFQDERANAVRLFEADGMVADVRVKRARRSESMVNASGRTFSATSRASLVSRAR